MHVACSKTANVSLTLTMPAKQEINDPGGLKQLVPPLDLTYAIMCEFTRMYIQSYMPNPAKEQDIRFIPLHEVDRDHVVHRKALEFQRAQDVLYGPCSFGNPPLPLDSMGYSDLLQHSVRRILACSQ